MKYNGNLDNIWKREKSLIRCLTDRICYFGNIDTYFKFIRRYVINAGGHPYQHALDTGCGYAFASIHLACMSLIQNLTLLDKFPENLDRNRQYIAENHPELKGRVTFVRKDLSKEPIEEKYDLVLGLTVITASELKPDNQKVENIFNAADTNGRVIISLPLKADKKEFSDYRKLTLRMEAEILMKNHDIRFLDAAMNSEELWVTGKRE